jgi:DNA-binding winged helix-turn-helix (wHTH) protein
MEFRVLGPLEVREGDRLLPLGGAKQRALLAMLVLNANRVVSRDRLIDALWGNEPPETAVQSVQVYVSHLRKLLPSDTLLTRPPASRSIRTRPAIRGYERRRSCRRNRSRRQRSTSLRSSTPFAIPSGACSSSPSSRARYGSARR